jgi:hypothetical protein
LLVQLTCQSWACGKLLKFLDGGPLPICQLLPTFGQRLSFMGS